MPKRRVKTISSFTYWTRASRSMYSALKTVHIFCAMLTIVGFILRGYWMLTSSVLLERRVTRTVPHIVDTIFLLSGIAMLVMLSLNPLTQSWLVAKFTGLLAYISLGMIALRRGPTRASRQGAFIGALAVYAYIVGVALSHSPLSWIAY